MEGLLALITIFDLEFKWNLLSKAGEQVAHVSHVFYLINLFISHAGYLACARCSSTGALVLIQPVATVNDGDQPLSPPRTERCSNCSGSGKVRYNDANWQFYGSCCCLICSVN